VEAAAAAPVLPAIRILFPPKIFVAYLLPFDKVPPLVRMATRRTRQHRALARNNLKHL
jgi:hypothetical protein